MGVPPGSAAGFASASLVYGDKLNLFLRLWALTSITTSFEMKRLVAFIIFALYLSKNNLACIYFYLIFIRTSFDWRNVELW